MAFTSIFKKLATSQAGRGAARGGDEQTDLYNVGAQLGFPQSPAQKPATPQMSPEQSEAVLQNEFAALAKDLAQGRPNAGSGDRVTQQPDPMAQMANPEAKMSPKGPAQMAQMANPGPKMSPKQMMEEAAFNKFNDELTANLKQSPLMNRDFGNKQSLSRKK